MAESEGRGDVDRLFEDVLREATSGRAEDEAYWNAVQPLQQCPPDEVWARLLPLAMAESDRHRKLVPDVVRLLGSVLAPRRADVIAIFRAMLERETSPQVIASIGAAAGELAELAVSELLLPFARHGEPHVRLSVALALQWLVSPDSITALIGLTSDESPDVRNWATFALSARDPDEPEFVDIEEIREALALRLEDPEPEVRAEAVLGLAKRKDGRAVPAIRDALGSRVEWMHYLEAAIYLPRREFCGPLQAFEAAGQVPAHWEDYLAAAITACAQAKE